MNKKDNKDLLEIKKNIEKFDDVYGVDNDINSVIIEDEYNLSHKFDIKRLEKFNIFEHKEIVVLKFNGINNLEELINCDFDSFIGITDNMKEKFELIRDFYNMNRGNQNEKSGKSK